LQDWQAEIAGLPFQPDEEEVLDSIVGKATAFRDFLHGFSNAACTTTEEVPTLIFYLRKIEGAEVLLAYETNFFRQEIHKWAPVAPQAPPILEQSLSTRKPRPTKQQKILAQFGVDRPEDLPEHLRAKHMAAAKRKSIDIPGSRPASLQPAPPTPGNNPPTTTGPTLTPMSDSTSAAYPFSANYSLPASDSTPAFAPTSSAFLPHAAAASQSPSFLPRSPSPQQNIEPSLFSPPRFGPEPQFASSSPRQNMDDVFADLTNEDPEAEPIENLHASEALEALDASNGSSREPSPTEESIPTATATATAPAAAASAEEEDAPAAKSPIVETTEDPESEL
jgi:histone demethylase JARID1